MRRLSGIARIAPRHIGIEDAARHELAVGSEGLRQRFLHDVLGVCAVAGQPQRSNTAPRHAAWPPARPAPYGRENNRRQIAAFPGNPWCHWLLLA